MKLPCPVCNAVFPIEAALMDAQARDAVAAALALPAPLGDRLLRYIGLFRPSQRGLSWDRAARLLQELLEPIQSARVERNNRTWSAPLAMWQAALDQILANRDKLQLPLKTHGYLLEIVAGMASKSEGAVESEKIARQQNPAHRPLDAQPISRDPAVTAAALGTLRNLTKGGV